MIDPARLAKTFDSLVRIDSISLHEGEIMARLAPLLENLGASVSFDDAGKKLGGESGNLIARLPGNGSGPPLLICAHVDTVEPGRGIVPILENGIFRSSGNTILGADDKSAVAVILETLSVLAEDRIPHSALEIIFTIAEEIGLLGAKNLDYGMVHSRAGYVLDAWDPDALITSAPCANRITFVVKGKSAHAGSSPEKGINAIAAAARAIAELSLGRVDFETTCNVGVIEGGSATNIVPDRVLVKAEARSHDESKLARVTTVMEEAFRRAVADTNRMIPPEIGAASVEVDIENDYRAMRIEDDHPLVRAAVRAGASLGRTVVTKASGGGSDANVFFSKGIPAAILGCGMANVHTTREIVSVDDMVKSTALLLRIITNHGMEG